MVKNETRAALAATLKAGAVKARRLFARALLASPRLAGRLPRRPWLVLPAAAAVLGVAMAASSTPRLDADLEAEILARTAHGDFGPAGLAGVQARLDPAQLALAIRHDPLADPDTAPGLTPGWETLSLGGKPSLEPGVSGLEAQKLNASTPAASGAWRTAPTFAFHPTSPADRARAVRCLTQAVYYEAALESDEGQAGVAQVILNRVRDPNYPSTVCGVVFQGAERVTGCQFSFTCDGSMSQPPVGWAWDKARKVAERALSGHVATRVGTATHYHADYVYPWWAPTLDKITRIGAHIFYRWKGVYGETAAFTSAYAGREPVIDEARFSRPPVALPTVQQASVEVAPSKGETPAGFRTVVVEGRERVVGLVNTGGRRAATAEDIAAINERLRAYEGGGSTPAQTRTPTPAVRPGALPAATPPTTPGVTTMDVEEVGKPSA